MSSRDTDLLAAVFADLDDDEPRLVYADYLIEHDDPRGELILVQCERARLEKAGLTLTPEYRKVYWREREIMADVVFDFRRGFIHRMNGFQLSDVSLFNREPIAEVEVGGARTLTELALLRSPALRSIVLRGAGSITLDAPTALDAIAREPLPEPSWELEQGLPHPTLIPAVTAVDYAVPTEQMLFDLARTDLPRLRALSCPNGLRFTGDGLAELLSSSNFASLKELEMWDLDERQLTAVAAAAVAPEKLTLATDSGPDEIYGMPAIEALVRSPALAHVRELSLPFNHTERMTIELARRATELESLTCVDGIDAPAFAASALPARLREIDVSCMGRKDGNEIASAPYRRLLSLSIGNADIGPALPNAPALETLVELRLYGCRMESTVRDAILDRFPFVRIE